MAQAGPARDGAEVIIQQLMAPREDRPAKGRGAFVSLIVWVSQSLWWLVNQSRLGYAVFFLMRV